MTLSNLKSINDLHERYWLKLELIKFCKVNKLPTQGSKIELIERIDSFFKTGVASSHTSKKLTDKDSLRPITKNTLVKNYNSDAKTREFFVSNLGIKFKFNSYLRQFTDKKNIKANTTYGDLATGWIVFENEKKGSKPSISKQFEYNQFIQDYFSNENNGTLQQATSAWKTVKVQKGAHTYAQFLSNKKRGR